jgi:hypothetical protein
LGPTNTYEACAFNLVDGTAKIPFFFFLFSSGLLVLSFVVVELVARRQI